MVIEEVADEKYHLLFRLWINLRDSELRCLLHLDRY
jgi:hypothetical protein